MMGRLLIYWGLAIDAFLRRDFYAAALCLIIPFTGFVGMAFAVLAGIVFAFVGHWIEAVVSWGYVIACLYGNRRKAEFAVAAAPAPPKP